MTDENLSTFSSDILAVDDVPENLKLLLNLLTPAGYKVRPASNGAEALDAVMSKKPDLILLDIKMPGMDGFEVCKRLKADSRSKDIPIIFISALDETADIVKAFHAGGVDYITKPFQEEEVLMRVGTHLELSRMRMNLENIVAEQTLLARKEAEQFRLVFENARDPIVWADPETGIILNCNQAAENLLEWSCDEIVGRHHTELHPPEEAESYAAIFESHVSSTGSAEGETVVLTKSGRRVPVWISSSVSQVGEKSIIQAIAHDITDRKEAKQTIEEQLAFEQLVSELSGQFVNLSAEKIDSAIIQGLGRVAEFIGAERASIVQPTGGGYNFSHYWTRQDISPAPPQAASMESYPWLARHVLGGSTVVLSQLDDLSGDAEEDKQMFMKLGIQSLLSLPLVANDVPVGAVSFTTVESQCHWPDQVVERMKLVALTLSHALERKRSQLELEERLRFEKLVSSVSKKFSGLAGEELEQAIQDALAEICKYFKVDAARIYRLSLKGYVLGFRVNWLSGHVTLPEESPEILSVKHPDMAAHYAQGKTVLFGNIDEYPQLPDLRKILNYFGTKAGVGVPLEIDGSGVDIFAMDNVLSERKWPKNIIEQSRSIGHILLNALQRREAEEELQENYDEIKQLKSRLELENIHLRKEIEVLYSHDAIIGNSQPIKTVLSQAEQVADQETSVLVLGETGTGKELLAHAIHDMSPRKKRAMITVNCAALPETLIEGELFGREKGAYTGALTKQVGRFELADKSTLFLDEIGDLPLGMQVKLLRVLQEGLFERLGSAKTINVDVRVIAATNHDLEQAVREGRFRKDLFYRLSVFPITVPPLRDRVEDIPMLVWAFVKDFSKRMGKTVENIPTKTMDSLMNYTWPGNVRELRNVIERAMIIHSGQTLYIKKIQTEGQEIDQPTSLEEVERSHIRSVLAKKNWKVSGKNGAADALGLKESTLRAKMGKLGIKRGE